MPINFVPLVSGSPTSLVLLGSVCVKFLPGLSRLQAGACVTPVEVSRDALIFLLAVGQEPVIVGSCQRRPNSMGLQAYLQISTWVSLQLLLAKAQNMCDPECARAPKSLVCMTVYDCILALPPVLRQGETWNTSMFWNLLGSSLVLRVVLRPFLAS